MKVRLAVMQGSIQPFPKGSLLLSAVNHARKRLTSHLEKVAASGASGPLPSGAGNGISIMRDYEPTAATFLIPGDRKFEKAFKIEEMYTHILASD